MIGIDLGSNTLQCVQYDCERREWGPSAEFIVRTADGLHQTGVIGDAAIERIIDALMRLKRQPWFESEAHCAVTTAAMRMASNAQEALSRIEVATGVRFRVIDAETEATYTMRAVQNRLAALGIEDDSFVLIDIGGGSSEVVIRHDSQVFAESFPVGIVTVAQRCETLEQIPRLLAEALEAVRAYAQRVYARIGRPARLVCTAGTPTTIAAFLNGMTYEGYDADRINGYVLDLNGCTKALAALQAMDEAERARYVGVGREDLIIAGVVIVEAFYRALGFEASIVVNDGVREGAVLEACRTRAAR